MRDTISRRFRWVKVCFGTCGLKRYSAILGLLLRTRISLSACLFKILEFERSAHTGSDPWTENQRSWLPHFRHDSSLHVVLRVVFHYVGIPAPANPKRHWPRCRWRARYSSKSDEWTAFYCIGLCHYRSSPRSWSRVCSCICRFVRSSSFSEIY